MTNEEIVRALWDAFDRFAFHDAAPLLHDDFVCEWPQSRERMRGRDNLIAMNANYPGKWRIDIKKLVACGGEVVTECHVHDGDTNFIAVSFFTLRDEKITYLREYWPDPMEAQEWRSQWVEIMED
jgi:ketosteroid isomerase-like protein